MPLGTLPGQTDRERVLVVLRHGTAEGSRLILQQQSWGEGVGWFTQGSLELATDQIAALKAVLGPLSPQAAARHGTARQGAAADGKAGSSQNSRAALAAAPATALRLVRADSA